VGTIQEVKVTTKAKTTTRQALDLFKTQKSTQTTKTTTKTTQKITPKPKPPVTKIPLLQRLSSKVGKKDEEGLFEAIAFKFGKEVSVAKGSKEEAAIGLKKFLKKGLSASGYLKTSKGEKLSASSLLGSFGSEFRVGKKSSTLIVEKKSKRLRKSGTGFEIQSFRPTGKKKKKNNFLFN